MLISQIASGFVEGLSNHFRVKGPLANHDQDNRKEKNTGEEKEDVEDATGSHKGCSLLDRGQVSEGDKARGVKLNAADEFACVTHGGKHYGEENRVQNQ